MSDVGGASGRHNCHVTCGQCGVPLPTDARFCPACAAPIEPSPTEERKLATVLFADLVGSTELGGQEDPERTRALLDRFYDAMAAEIEGAGGTVEKFVGDAVMAAFGVPAAQEDHAERALHAALSMQRRLQELFGDRLEMRVAVNTGEVVVSRPREGSSFVTGDTVNVAARLEQAAAPGETLVGERTVGAVGGAFEFGQAATVEAKGKLGGVACRPLRRALLLMRPRGIAGMRRAFVGRESELDELRTAYRHVAEAREPRLVVILGDPGLGKTTLVREFSQQLATESPEPLRRTGRCLPYGRGITYWPLGEVLKEHFGIRESDPPETAERRLGGRQLLGLTLGLDVGGDLHPLAVRDRLHDSWVEFLDELITERPAVLIVEDLHWAENDLLDLLETVMREASGPLLLVTTARPELLDRRSRFGAGRRGVSHIWLEPLGREDAQRMLESLLESELPARLDEIVIERAEGNPLFVEELLATLVDQGVLLGSDEGWAMAELPAGFRVPDTVQAVLATRIDLLPPAEKAALQAASVIGRVFWTGPVYELLGDIQADLRILEERGFIRRRSGSSVAGEREYAIKHALTREVAYDSLPKASRARLHAGFAAWLERVGEGRTEHASVLAHHYAEAVRPEDADLAWAGADEQLGRVRAAAVGWLRRAGELAMGRYEVEQALVVLHQALALEEDRMRQAELWHAIGHANALGYDGERFWTAMQNAIEISPDRRTSAEIYGELVFQTSIRSAMWKRKPDRDVVVGWIKLALELAEPGTRGRARALLARAEYHPLDGEAAATEASAIAERLDDPELRSYALEARGDLAFYAGRYREAAEWAGRRLEAVESLSDPDNRADAHLSATFASIALGRIDDGRRLAEAHDDITAGLTPHHRTHAVGLRVIVEESAADWEAVRALTLRVEEAVAANLATPCVLDPRSLLVCALAHVHSGDDLRARRLEESAGALGIEGYGLSLLAPRIRLALVRGQRATVERLLAEEEPDPEGPASRVGSDFLPVAARLDGLAALGDRRRLDEEAPRLAQPGTYLEPFALRALGVVRDDPGLIEQAAARFDAMRLAWHAADTRRGVVSEAL
jgi:class 3 adenylate cyclase